MSVIQKTLLGDVILAGSGSNTYTMVASDETNQLAQEDVRLLADTSTGVVDVTLPLTTDLPAENVRIIVFDSGAAAATSNITVRAAGEELINGAATTVVNTNSGSVILYVAKSGQWIAK